MVYLISSIKEISRDKIIYCDNDGVEKEISLPECGKNWAEYYNSNIHNYVNWDLTPASEISVEDNTCVGRRDWFDENPYFEFFATPVIRFEIRPKKRFLDHFIKYWRQRYSGEFSKISLDLEKAGWCTFDLG